MSLMINRQTVHQVIDQLPENTLPELIQFIAFLQFKTEQNAKYATWPEDFFETVIGGWQGEPLTRPEQGSLERRETL